MLCRSRFRLSVELNEINRFFLKSDQISDILFGQRYKPGKHFTRKWFFFGGTLNLDKISTLGHDDIHICFGLTVEGIIEISYRISVNYSDTYCSHPFFQW